MNMKVEYGLSDYQKRIILTVGYEQEIAVADIFIYLNEFKDEFLHLFYEMPEEFRKLLKEQIHAKNNEKKRASLYSSRATTLEWEKKGISLPKIYPNLNKPQDRFGLLSNPIDMINKEDSGDFSVPDSFASYEIVSEADIKDILHELQGLSFIGLICTGDSATDITSGKTTVSLTEYGMDIYQRIAQGRNPIIRKPGFGDGVSLIVWFKKAGSCEAVP